MGRCPRLRGRRGHGPLPKLLTPPPQRGTSPSEWGGFHEARGINDHNRDHADSTPIVAACRRAPKVTASRSRCSTGGRPGRKSWTTCGVSRAAAADSPSPFASMAHAAASRRTPSRITSDRGEPRWQRPGCRPVSIATFRPPRCSTISPGSGADWADSRRRATWSSATACPATRSPPTNPASAPGTRRYSRSPITCAAEKSRQWRRLAYRGARARPIAHHEGSTGACAPRC